MLCAYTFVWATDAELERAKTLLDQGAVQAAYELLAPLQPHRAGDPDYDYLFAVCALELGHRTEAVLALERVLSVEPDNALARAQLARAYFDLKETESARREFEALDSQDLPLQLRGSIGRYLSAIEQITEGQRPSARFFLEFATGYDSNVNGGPESKEFAVPAIPGTILRLSPSARKTADGFLSVSSGLQRGIH
jgi:outer membrane protein